MKNNLSLHETMTRREQSRFAQSLNKPVYGDKCNGCGYCCMMKPCSISLFIYNDPEKCPALVFREGKYRCGLISEPEKVLPIAFVVPEGAFDDPEVQEAMEGFAAHVAKKLGTDTHCCSTAPHEAGYDQCR